MYQSKHFGLVGGLGVGATVLYYQGIAAACAERSIVPRLTVVHANAPTALAFVQAGKIEDLAAYLAGFVGELAASGASFFAIPAITPHICLPDLKRRVSLPMVDILQVTARRLRDRRLSRVALFGTKFTIDRKLFGALDAFDIVRPRMTRSMRSIGFIWHWRRKDRFQPTMRQGCENWRIPSAGAIALRQSYWPALTSTSSSTKRMRVFPQSTVRPPTSMRSWSK
jgi:hypothetical protein